MSLISTFVGCHRRPAERGEIRIGVLIDRTDPADVATVNSANLAVAAVNDAGGLDLGGEKHHVVLLIEDMKTTPGEAVDAARRLIHQQGVVAVVGPGMSHFAIPVAN
ncbi:MAG: ABC transporter substrate-binding protein, partial [bacterium]|nr:ABC transporter substrate-binding protein [bacterium]